VLVADAVELGNQIIGQAEQLARQRADLDALNRLLVGENRRLNRAVVFLLYQKGRDSRIRGLSSISRAAAIPGKS
jgi:hypothetical protein